MRFLSRIVFALVCASVFLAGLFASFWWSGPIIIALLVGATIGWIYQAPDQNGRKQRALELCDRFLYYPLGSNNRWLVTLLTFAFLAFWLAWFTKPGLPEVRTITQAVTEQLHGFATTELEQRRQNVQTRGEYKTDAELGLEERPEVETGNTRKLIRESWSAWQVRWTCLLLLILLTVGYLPFAFFDEGRWLVQEVLRRWDEQSEGSTEDPGWIKALRGSNGNKRRPRAIPPGNQPAPAQPAAGTAPSAGALTSHSWMFIMSLLAELAGRRIGRS
jgi:hypothetical protein